MTNQSDEALFPHTKETYGGSFNADLLEQYKLYVQSAENVSARRVASSRYLLTVNAALVAFYGFQSQSFGQGWLMVPIPVLGILVSCLWHQIIQSHKDLNTVKFTIIHKIEQHFPVALYAHEWHLAEDGRGKSYRSVTDIERWIPLIFSFLHFVFLAVLVWNRLPIGGDGPIDA